MKKHLLAAAIAAMTIANPAWSAGIPVIDAAGLVQAIQQVTQMAQQIEQLQNQLETAKQQYESLNGSRGMADLINDPAARKYLPPNAQELFKLYEGASSGRYSGLSGSIEALKQANRVLTTSGANASQVDSSRNLVALHQATAEAAYSAADQRFSTYEQLIQRLQNAPDPKSVMELQARIQAESVMMQNEQVKLQIMRDLMEAKEKAERLKQREEVARMGKGTAVYARMKGG